jgi:hypothetical protein
VVSLGGRRRQRRWRRALLLPTSARERQRDGDGEIERVDFFLERSERDRVRGHVRRDAGGRMSVSRYFR